MLLPILANVFGILVFLFLYWKRLKEDYPQSAIFGSASLILFGLLLSGLISSSFLQEWWFFLHFLFISVGVMAAVFKYKMRVFEVIEALVVSLLAWLTLFLLTNGVSKTDTPSLIFAGACLLFLLFFAFLDANYRKLSWYRSGRIGFAGLLTLGVFFLLRCLIALLFPGVVSFVGKEDALISGVIAFFSFLGVFNLARTNY